MMQTKQSEQQSMTSHNNVDERSFLLGRRSWSHFALYENDADDNVTNDDTTTDQFDNNESSPSRTFNNSSSKVCKFSTPTWDEVVTTPPIMPQRKVSLLLQTFYEEDEDESEDDNKEETEEPISPYSSCSKATSTSTTATSTESDDEFDVSPSSCRSPHITSQPTTAPKFAKFDCFQPPLTYNNDIDRRQPTNLREQNHQQQKVKKLEGILKKYSSSPPLSAYLSNQKEQEISVARSSSSPLRLSNFLECNNNKSSKIDDNGSIESDCETLLLLQIQRKEQELERIQLQAKYELDQLQQSQKVENVIEGELPNPSSSNCSSSNNSSKKQQKYLRSAKKIQKLCNQQVKQIKKDIKKLKKEYKKRSSTLSTSKSKSRSRMLSTSKKSNKKTEKK